MTIKSQAQAKASQYVKEQRNVAESVVLRRDTAAIQRSTNDGSLTRTVTNTSVNAILENYRRYEIVASLNANASTAIQPNDLRCKIAAIDLGFGIQPSPQDRIVRADGSIFNIISVVTDAPNAWWTLQLRRP